MATLQLLPLTIYCVIGVLPEEQIQPQELIVTPSCRLDVRQAAESDQLSHTVDYMQLAKICQEVAEKAPYQLLERYAYLVLSQMLEELPVDWVHLEVLKPAVGAKISMSMTREEWGQWNKPS